MAEAQSESLVFASLLILPATVALFVLAEPITAVLFQRGAFLAEDARATAALLKVLALALPAFVLIKVILPTFLAREEMRPPLIAVGLGLAANIAGAALFRDVERAIAPAAGVAIGVWVNALVLAFAAQGRMSILPRAWARAFAALLAAVVMGFCIGWLAMDAKDWMAPERAFYEKGSVLALICLAGLTIYAAVARLLRAFTFRRLRRIGQKSPE